MSNTLVSVNPLDGKELNRYTQDTSATVDNKLERAQEAFQSWSQLSPVARGEYLATLAAYIRKHKERMAAIATDEMGKPLAQGIAELEKSATALEYYAKHAADFLQQEPVATEAQRSYISFQPLGTVLAIMPWNFPYWQVYRAMGPILLGGNTMVLKHASNVTGCAIAMEEAMIEAGMPADIFKVLLLPSSEIEAVIASKHIHAVTFTGSTTAGSKVASVAGKHLKKQVLELGGSDAYVVLADADIDQAVNMCVQSRLNNTGQSCIAAKRFIVERPVLQEFTEKMVAAMQAKKYGDPKDAASNLGPMARTDLRDELHKQVEASVAKGAKIMCGGQVPDQPGAFYPSTVLAGVTKGMPAYDEEMFGPVAAVIEAENEEDAIRIANDSVFGLGGAIFSRDIEKAEAIAEKQLQAGTICVNDFVRSDARLPFGGVKQSGYGRELSHFGLREFVNVKTIYVK